MTRAQLAYALEKLGKLWEQVDQTPLLPLQESAPLVGKAELILDALAEEFRSKLLRH